jgi:hypothetical protein
MTVIEILILLALFQIKHFLADYPLQNRQMVTEKGSYGKRGGVYHSLIHSVTTLVALGVFDYFVHAIDFGLAVAISLSEFVIHYHIDWSKMQMSRRFSTEDKGFWNWIGFDQLLHHATYIGFAWILAL